ncbi:DUF4270 domain-containing protein [Winogradskyella sp.]|uniref:DUF4270 domain-containing protein n=1 Tax=Winogradskyella sp. TaxID=1883156 RepID=UPI0025D86EA3|nr:DUF4270 domain-containing protein [Winogradskyella sp.]
MKRNKFALQITVFGLIVLSFIACDKDFADLESDIINNQNATNFSIESEQHDVITYTKALGPVETNNLGVNINSLGIYDDGYGRSTYSFVNQITASAFDPDFGDEVVIDSVVLSLPYFSSAKEVEDSGNILYDIDSVLPKTETYESIKLRVFENNYFLRDFDPNGEFDEAQAYFSNKSASMSEAISDAALEGEELIFLTGPQTSYPAASTDNIINISDEGFVLEEDDEDGQPQVSQRLSPGIRIKLDPAYWQNKIIDKEGDPVLSSQNNFAEYFRGLYFKAEANENNGSFMILDTGNQNANITIHYTRLTTSTTDDASATEQSSFVLRFGPNRINFIDNNFTTPIIDGDDVNGDSELYLKGGEGSFAVVKLFDGFYDQGADITNFEKFRSDFVNLDDNDEFISSKRLVNEANLVFYVNQESVQNNEPNRIFLYDIDNNLPLTDYNRDASNNSLPSFSIINHLGPLQRVGDEPTGDGIKYKLKITEHINNLLLRDSTNVKLGLSVSLNVNLENQALGLGQKEVQSADDPDIMIPLSSVLSPRGTVLHGNNTQDQSKKVYLEIYYTEPN